MGSEQFLEERRFSGAGGTRDNNGGLGNYRKVRSFFSFFSLTSSLKPSESIPVVISFLMGIIIGNWNRGEVEYCMDLCISLKSFGVLAAGRLKHSITYQNLTSCICTGVFFWWGLGLSRARLKPIVSSQPVTRHSLP